MRILHRSILLFSLVVPLLFVATPSTAETSSDVLRPGKPADVHWMVGLDGGPDVTWYTAGPFYFMFPDVYRPLNGTMFLRQFESGSGVGMHIGGHIDWLFSENAGVTFGLRFATRHATFSETNLVPCSDQNGVTDTAIVSDELSTTIGVLSLEIMGKFYLTKSLYLNAGVAFGFHTGASWEIHETLGPLKYGYFPKCYYLDDYQDSVLNPELSTSGSFTSSFPTQVDIRATLGYEIPVGGAWYVVPALGIGIPLTEILTAHPAIGIVTGGGSGVYNNITDAGTEEAYSPKTIVLYPSIGITYRVR